MTKGATSRITINAKTNVVAKHVVAYASHQVFEREVYWLNYLNERKYSWCPKLLSCDPRKKIIRMEYVGVTITGKNAPKDWKEQLQTILDDLKKEGINHNDIKRTEVLVKNGKLYLIDYGWSSKGNDWSCGGMLNNKKKPCHVFHDKDAMVRIQAALNRTS